MVTFLDMDGRVSERSQAQHPSAEILRSPRHTSHGGCKEQLDEYKYPRERSVLARFEK